MGSTRSVKFSKASVIFLALTAMMLGLMVPAIASESTSPHQWEGGGTDSEACNKDGEGPRDGDWIHWIFSTRGDGTNFELALGGSGSGGPYSDTNQSGAVHFYTPYFDLDSLSASVTWTGEAGPGNGLVISDWCAGDDDVEITVAKSWTGDAYDNAGVGVALTVEVNGTEHDNSPFAPGDKITVKAGDKVEIANEAVTGFDVNNADCSFSSTLPGALTDVQSAATLTVTNDVTCDDGQGDESFDVIITKIVDGEAPEGADFEFAIECLTPDGEPGVSDVGSLIDDGDYGDTYTIATVPEGQRCIVTETETENAVSTSWEFHQHDEYGDDVDGTSESGSGVETDEFEVGSEMHVVFTNDYTPQAPTLTVNKVWTGDSRGEAGATFEVVIRAPFEVCAVQESDSGCGNDRLVAAEAAVSGDEFDIPFNALGVEISETVGVLPDGCSSSITSVVDDQQLGTRDTDGLGDYGFGTSDLNGDIIVTFTNDVDCGTSGGGTEVEESVIEPAASITSECVADESLEVSYLLDNTLSEDGVTFGVDVTGQSASEIDVDAEASETGGFIVTPDDANVIVVVGAEGQKFVDTTVNAEDCVEPDEAVEVLPDAEEAEPEPDPEPVQVLDQAAEVVSEQASLPDTGASALVLTLMGLLSMGLGGALLRPRKRD